MQKMSFRFNPMFPLLTFQIIYNIPDQNQHQGNWTWNNLWNLLTIRFKNKSFHNSIEWSWLNLQVNIITPWLGKFFRFSVFRLLENAFIIYETSPQPSGDMIWPLVPACRNDLAKICRKKFVSNEKHLFRKKKPYSSGGHTM